MGSDELPLSQTAIIEEDSAPINLRFELLGFDFTNSKI